MKKYANLVELDTCCQFETHVFLQNFVLIQPRTSPPKICKNSSVDSSAASFQVAAGLAARREPAVLSALPRGFDWYVLLYVYSNSKLERI